MRLEIKQCRLVFNEFTLYKLLVALATIVVYNPFSAVISAIIAATTFDFFCYSVKVVSWTRVPLFNARHTQTIFRNDHEMFQLS